MSELTAAPDQIAYMDAAAGTAVGLDYKQRLVRALGLRDRPNVELHVGDAHDLPLADASVDRAKVDRVLQHVEDPASAIAEVRRVLRPGGVFDASAAVFRDFGTADLILGLRRLTAGPVLAGFTFYLVTAEA
jgi:ubiquinone/menaquinone biosynthesis C-methylase UbiE